MISIYCFLSRRMNSYMKLFASMNYKTDNDNADDNNKSNNNIGEMSRTHQIQLQNGRREDEEKEEKKRIIFSFFISRSFQCFYRALFSDDLWIVFKTEVIDRLGVIVVNRIPKTNFLHRYSFLVLRYYMNTHLATFNLLRQWQRMQINEIFFLIRISVRMLPFFLLFLHV